MVFTVMLFQNTVNLGFFFLCVLKKFCTEISRRLGIACMIVDANDYGVEILGKSEGLRIPDEILTAMVRDNPANNFREQTPFVLIRPVEKLRLEWKCEKTTERARYRTA